MSQPNPSDKNATVTSFTQLEPPPPAMLNAPLNFISAQHLCQRSLCALLRDIARSRRVRRAVADKVLAFLTHDLVQHHQDEEVDLFPALRKRADPEDGLAAILARLSIDHREFDCLVAEIVAALSAKPVRDWIAIPPQAAEPLLAYASLERRHLSVENGIVLVIARKCLPPADLRALSRSMKQRRGMEF